MRARALLVLLAVGLVVVIGCHEIYPYGVKPGPDTGPPDAALLDIGQQADAGVHDAPRLDVAVDATNLDTLSPDLVPPPDHGPYWDQGGTTCNSLLAASKPVQVSVKDANSGRAPSITAIGDTFYVAFLENNAVWVRAIDAATPTPLTTAKLSSKLSLTAKVGEPWITYNAVSKRLGVVWHEWTSVTTGTCYSNLHFRELSPTLAFNSYCHLNKNHTTYGYGPASMIHDGTNYVLVSPVQYVGSGCNAHAKFKFHAFSGCTPFSGAVNSLSPLYSTHHTVITGTGDASYPYLLIRLYDGTGSTNPATLDVWPHSGTAAGVFPQLTSFAPEQGLNDRPSAVKSGGGAWLAWTTTARQLKLHYRTSSTIGPKFLVGGFGKNPFLAHKPQVGTGPANAKTVLAYAETTSTGNGMAVKLAVLQDALNKVASTLTIAGASSTGAYSMWRPEQTVVAAGTNGFGVAWTETVATNQTEIFFQWVGCQP